MPYCPKCLVGLDPLARCCPLCGAAPVDTLPAPETGPEASPPARPKVRFPEELRDADERERLSPRDIRKMVVELESVAIGLILAVTIVLDVFVGHGLTWSRFTSVTLAYLWLCMAMPLILWGRPWLVFSVLGPTTLVEVFAWFALTGHLGLFPVTGLPIALLVEGVVVACAALVAIERNKGLNVIGTVIAGVAVICLGIEFFASLSSRGSPALGWSAIVAIAILPVAGLFFYLHYRIMNRASLKKIFRL